MQKHFNEKYMESEKFSMSYFKGNFKEKVALSKNQSIKIEAQGVLNMHGIDRDVSIVTDLYISDGEIQFSSIFDVFLNDYKIKVPKFVRMNIADTIQVNVSGSLIEIFLSLNLQA